jgi:hypothetical protein
MVFVPFHWGDLFGEGNAANYLTISAIGRVAKQPELKFCAVNLEKAALPHVRRDSYPAQAQRDTSLPARQDARYASAESLLKKGPDPLPFGSLGAHGNRKAEAGQAV